MTRRTMRRAALAAISAVALAAGGCGDDDETTAEAPVAAESSDDGALADAAPGGSPELPQEPPAAPPEEAAECLEDKGYTAEVGGAVADDVAAATGLTGMVQITGADGGAGSISYFENNAASLEAATAENPPSGSVSARKSNTYWVFVGDHLQQVTKDISTCL